MPDGAALPVLDHELADDELQWMKSVYADFSKARAAAGPDFNPKEALRAILARAEYHLSAAPDLSGPGPWRLGQNRHGRGVAAVFLPKVELHTHIASRTDQFPMYVVGEAEGFSLDEKGKPVLEPVVGGSHFHNAPGAPHAFVPKVGIPKSDNWEIAFIAITPRNLKEERTGSRTRFVRCTGRLSVRTPLWAFNAAPVRDEARRLRPREAAVARVRATFVAPCALNGRYDDPASPSGARRCNRAWLPRHCFVSLASHATSPRTSRHMPVTRRVMIATATLAAARPAAAQTQGKAMTTETGLKYIDTTVGTGASSKSGQTCVMHYTGWLSEGGAKGRKFDFPWTAARPSSFPSA